MLVSENQPFSKLPIQSATDRIVLMGDPRGRVFTPDMIPVGTHEVTLLIGPEGGWSDEELAQVDQAGATRVRIAGGILRTETAAIQFAGLAAGLGACLVSVTSLPAQRPQQWTCLDLGDRHLRGVTILMSLSGVITAVIGTIALLQSCRIVAGNVQVATCTRSPQKRRGRRAPFWQTPWAT